MLKAWYSGILGCLLLAPVACSDSTAGHARGDAGATCLEVVPLDAGFEALLSHPFYSISAVRMGERGEVYVLDAMDDRLHAFTREGHLWSAGGEGSGPTEFRQPEGMGLWGDTIVVYDFANHRLSLWGPDGAHARTIPIASLFSSTPFSIAMAGDHKIIAFLIRPFTPPPPPELPGVLLMLSADGSTVDTLAHFSYTSWRRVRTSRGERTVPVPFTYFPYASILRDRLSLRTDPDYRVELHPLDGGEPTVIERPGRPPMGEAQRQRYRNNVSDTTLHPLLEFPDSLPALSGILGLGDGRIALKTYWERDGKARWDLWSLEGDSLGFFWYDVKDWIAAARGDTLLVVSRDEWDVASLAFQQLRASPCPGHS